MAPGWAGEIVGLFDHPASVMTMPSRRLPPLIAETIAIGSELLIGGRTDSNSLFIAEELCRLGIQVRFKSVVGDDEADIMNALRTAASRARVIVMTG